MTLMKHFLCSAAAVAGLAGCGQPSADTPLAVPTDRAYCLDDPASPEVQIIATQTNDLMYRATRPSSAGHSTLLKTFDGQAENRLLAVTPESCQVYGNTGPVLGYTRISSRLR